MSARREDQVIKVLYKCKDHRADERINEPVLIYKLGTLESHVPSYLAINHLLYTLVDFDVRNSPNIASMLRAAQQAEGEQLDDFDFSNYKNNLKSIAEARASLEQREQQQQQPQEEEGQDEAAALPAGENLSAAMQACQITGAQQLESPENDDEDLDSWHRDAQERARQRDRAQLDRERHRAYGEESMRRTIREAQEQGRQVRQEIDNNIRRLEHLRSLEEVRRARENNDAQIAAQIQQERERQRAETSKRAYLEKEGLLPYKNVDQMSRLERTLENAKRRIEMEKVNVRMSNLPALREELNRTRELRFYEMVRNKSPILLKMPEGRWKDERKALADKSFGISRLRQRDETMLQRLAKAEIPATHEATFVLLKKMEGVDTSMWSTLDVLREFHDYKVRKNLCTGITQETEEEYQRIRANEEREILERV